MQELLAAIVVTPDDDAPRRVYADALLEGGEPLGELIHLQCELAAGGLTRDEAVVRRRRERELLKAHGARWTAGLQGIATYPVFRRGFVDEVVVDAEHFPELGEPLFAAAPALRAVRLDGITGNAEYEDENAVSARILERWQRTITCPSFGRLRGVGFSEIGYSCRVFGEVTPGWESLGSHALAALLAVDTSRLDALDARSAAHGTGRGPSLLLASPLLKQLSRLSIWPDNYNVTLDLFRALVDVRLRSLALYGNYLEKLDYPVLGTLIELRIESDDLELAIPLEKLERLAYAYSTVRNASVEHAIAVAPNLRELSLEGEHVPGWQRLARAELPRLRVLRVHGDDVTADEAEAILQMPCAARLEVLYVKRIDEPARARLEDRYGVVVDVSDPNRRAVYWR